MPSHGRPASSQCLTTPPDLTLTTNPVPRTRTFALRSFGPSATPNIRALVHSPQDVRAEADPATYLNPMGRTALPDTPGWNLPGIRRDLATSLGVDLTWGFHVFVVDYAPDTLEKIP